MPVRKNRKVDRSCEKIGKPWFIPDGFRCGDCRHYLSVLAVFTGAAKKDSIISRTLGGVLLPAERGITMRLSAWRDTYNKFHGYDALKAENDSLKKQVTDLTKQLESAQADVKENKELKSMLGVSERNTSFSYEQAQVIGRTLDEWSSVLTIDAGSKDGLEKHDCVVTSQGMVGYISDLSDHTAQVTTIIDKNMSAAHWSPHR